MIYVAPAMRLGPGFRVQAGAMLVTRTPGFQIFEGAPRAKRVEQLREDQGVANAGSGADEFANAPEPSRRLEAHQLPAALAEILSAHDANVQEASIDATERYILFATEGELIHLDRNGLSDIYWYDTVEDQLLLVSVSPEGAAGNGPSRRPRMDGTALWIVFESKASNLVDADANEASDIFLTETVSWLTTRASWSRQGAEAPAGASHPALDAAGDQVLYDRLDSDGYRQIYGYDLKALATDRLSLPEDDAGRSLDNHHPGISADGRYVVYLEGVPASGAEPATCAVHFYDRDADVFERLICPEALANKVEFIPYFSADGAQVQWIEDEVTADPAVWPTVPSRIVKIDNPLLQR